MDPKSLETIQQLILEVVPSDGSAIGNAKLELQLMAAAKLAGVKVKAASIEAAKAELIAEGTLARGKGRGGSVRLTNLTKDDFTLKTQSVPPTLFGQSNATKKNAPKRAAASAPPEEPSILSYRHADKRKNNPQVGLVNEANDPAVPKTEWRYDPHIDPALAFDSSRAYVEKLIDDALSSGDESIMKAALTELKRADSPYLNWAGKAERTSFDIDTVSLHVHERVDSMSILAAVRKKQQESTVKKSTGQQAGLFAAPFENLPLRDAIDFYKHDRGWANRLIAGDSLLVMNSLLQKESMAGQVQMIYIDPPYGIKYGSNFQPFVGKRDVKDRRDADLTQEPEMIKAFRDTWELGIHSYLTYLRDRLFLSHALLNESGSVFVQISDENLHLVRTLLDEIFGNENFCRIISVTKTAGFGATLLPVTQDYLLWYAKNLSCVKFRQLNTDKVLGDTEEDFGNYKKFDELNRRYRIDNLTGQNNNVQSCLFGYDFSGRTYSTPSTRQWKTTEPGMNRLANANRLEASAEGLYYKRMLEDFSLRPITDKWGDTGSGGFGDEKLYVVQTGIKVIERCLVMTTDPGDLVLDPTCGSGTTAYVAEKWGRRWITCDTSRVATTLAKQRLATAGYDYYELRYPNEGLRGGFIYKTVPHVTLKSIATNLDIEGLYAELHPAITKALTQLDIVLAKHPHDLNFIATEGGRKGKKVDFRNGDKLLEWEVPFDFPDNWPQVARNAFDAFHSARQNMRKLIDASIAAHAESETLYDQPEKSKTKLRITGPFTVEAVPFPSVLSLNETAQPQEADVAIARSGESSRQHTWRDELLKTGIRGKGRQMLQFASLETLPGTQCLHATGTLDSGERVVVSFGPEYAALEQRQVEHAIREAGELFPLPKIIVFCAFAFDPEAAKDIDAYKGITALKAQMNTDLLTEDLKKARSSNQSFWLMGQPDAEARKQKDGTWIVEVNGFDYFDTVRGELISGGKGKIAMWLLDTDYDDRSLFPRQVFFPMAGKDDGWKKLKKDIRAELDESLLEQFHGTVSLPFAAGENRKVAIKIVDDRGIESLKIIPLS
ncbi:MAG: site-specific DNA-methyltransferase [Betaproteobacteria bacterium]